MRAPKLRKIGIISGVVLLVVAVLLGVGYWLVVPGIADSLVRDKLDAAETKLGLQFEIDEVATHGVSAVSLMGFSVIDPTTNTPLFEAASISASIDAAALLLGERKLSGIKISDTTFYVHRNADGSTNLEEIIARAKDKPGDSAEDASQNPPEASEKIGNKLDGAVSSFLRFFGDSWPDITVENARVLTSADDAAKPWALEEISTDTLTLESGGDSAQFSTLLTLKRGTGHPRWSLPENITIKATVQRPILESTGSIVFSSPLQIVGAGPYPFLRLGVGEVVVSEDNTVSLGKLSVGVQGDSTPTKLARIEKFSASFKELTPSVLALRPLEIHIESPTLFLDYDAQSGNALNDLNQLMRAPRAGHIVGVAKRLSDSIAVAQGREPDTEDPSGGGLRRLLAGIDWTSFLANKAPQQLEVTNASIRVNDARNLDLVTSDPTLSLKNGNFKFSHRVINGTLDVSGGFDAVANSNEPRGKAQVDLEWSYRKNSLKIDTKIDALSIPWLVQLTSDRIADNLRGGMLHANVKAERAADSSRLQFEGLVSVQEATFFLSLLAEKPVERLSASYNFEGFYDPKAPIPAPKLLAVAAPQEQDDLDLDGVPPGDQAGNSPKSSPDGSAETEPLPPEQGAFVISKGHFEVNGVAGEFRPALFGLDGLKKRPTRFDTAIELPKTPVDTLFKAVPDAIKGPLTGTKMRGTFGWTLALEMPLYQARDMKWDAQPVLSGFELLSMPEAVDVRKLRDEFQMTIYDPTLEWSRNVTIPAMRPVPLEWLSEQSGLEMERFEKRRRIRQWPPMTGSGPDATTAIKPYPAPWAAEEAAAKKAAAARKQNGLNTLFGLNQAAADTPDTPELSPPEPQPNTRRTPSGKIPADLRVMLDGKPQKHPYGPYSFVPLQYISPWMLRAAITTEDNSFFKHHGFNWLAIRHSIEANIEAGRYVRGASTIPMQLIKNIFLTRDKVMVRKLREIFMVWLMEDVVDIPKARIIELYFNIIEYGPGIFGIHDAAVHYFGKRADKLSLTEVAWLVSIVPNPKKFHFYFERGEISDSWFRRMLRYVRVMYNRERATEADYESAKLDKPRFYKPQDGEPMMRIERDPQELDELMNQTDTIQMPGLQDLFGP